MKTEITYWKGTNLGSQRKEWMKKNLRLEEIEAQLTEPVSFSNNYKAGKRKGYIEAMKENQAEPVSEEIMDCLNELIILMDDVITGDYKPDSFTTQNAKIALQQRQVNPPNKD